MDGQECKRKISKVMEFLTPFQYDRNKSMCWRITLTNYDTSVEYVDYF